MVMEINRILSSIKISITSPTWNIRNQLKKWSVPLILFLINKARVIYIIVSYFLLKSVPTLAIQHEL